MWWISCCWSAEEDDRASTSTEACLTPEKAVRIRPSLPSLPQPVSPIESAANLEPLDLIRLPSLPIERSKSEDPKLMNDDLVDEPYCEAETTAVNAPRRCISSELGSGNGAGLGRSLRNSRSPVARPAEDSSSEYSSPSTKRRQLRRVSHVSVDLDRTAGSSPVIDLQNAGYSSWFALLSKSIGSEVSSNSPAWFIGSQAATRQIEGT